MSNPSTPAWPFSSASVLIFTLICVGMMGAFVEAVAATGDQPNIIFLFTDDQRFDALGFLHPVLETPNLDALAGGGVYFPNAFVTTPICPSSRATVLTGLHEQAHGFTFFTPLLRLEFLEHSYPKLLRDQGYTTGFVGKNGALLDGERIELLFDDFVPVTLPYFQVRDGENIHATDYTARKAADFIAEAAEPFMLSVWFNAPHAEDGDPAQFIPPERHNELYTGIDFPVPPTGDPDFFLALPKFLRQSLNRERWFWRWTPQLYDPMMSRYLAMITGVDDAVGEILEQTIVSGVADRTVMIFMSDNGYFVGERGFAGKWLAYEPSIRTPLLIHDPRAAAGSRGRVLPQLVLNVDLPETILELAGVEVPATMQGRSLVPLLDGETPPWRQDFFVEHTFTAPPSFVIPQHESLRTAELKYVHYLEHDHEELFDLRVDPHEETDVADQPAYREQLEAVRRRTIELKQLDAGVLFADGFESGVVIGSVSVPRFTRSDRHQIDRLTVRHRVMPVRRTWSGRQINAGTRQLAVWRRRSMTSTRGNRQSLSRMGRSAFVGRQCSRHSSAISIT